MISSAIRCLVFVGVVCAFHKATAEAIEHVNTWGDLSTQVVLGSSKSKIGVPFVQRSLEFTYPDVSFHFIPFVAGQRK